MQDNSPAIDLSAGLVQKPEGIDLSAGLRPLAVNLPGGTSQLAQQVQNNPQPGDQTKPTEFEKEHSPEGQPGVGSSLGDNILSKVESLPRFFSGMGGTNAAKRGYDAIEHDQQRQAAGRSLPYRAAAYVGDLLGVSNPTVQEKDAEHGNVRGVAGNAIGDLIPAVLPLAAEGLRVAAPQIAESTSAMRDAAADSLKEGASRQYGRVLAPSRQANKFLAEKKVIPEALQRGIVARSGPALEEQAANRAQVAGQAVDDAVDALPRSPTIATEPIIKHLESYKQEFINQIPVTDQEFGQLAAQGKPVNILEDGTKVKEVNLDPDAVDRINQMQQIIKDHGDMVDYQSLRKARQVFDEKVAKANGYAGKTLSEGTEVDVKRESASAIRRELAKANPDIAKLNAEYSFWENLRKVSADTNQRRVGQLGGGLTRKIAQSTGAAVGGTVAGVKGALIGAALGKRFSQLFNSTAWQTVSAVTKNKVANLLASGDSAGALKALNTQPATKALSPKSPLPFLNPPEGTTPPPATSPLPFLKPTAEAQPVATGTTGQAFLDLLNKSVSNTKRDAGLDETIATQGAVPRGYDPVTGGYAFEVPTKGGLSQKVLPADQITPESIRQAKSSANGAKAQGSPIPNPEDVQMANRYRVGQLQKSLRKSSDQQERTELQSAINQITEQLPKRSEAPFTGQERRNQPEINQSAQQSGIPNPGYAGQVPVASIKQAPHRFQYKLNTDAEGVGTLLKEQNNYNPDLAGVISVWRDPADGQLYVVNGHHRLELAKRTGQTSVLARHIVAKDATEARAIGALQNIAEGRGTAIDAAKFMRDTGISVDDLKAKGISMGEATAAKGSALSNLDDSLFNKTVQGEMPLERAAAIGDATPDHAEQRAISELIDRQEKKGKKVNNDTLRELVRFVKGSGQSQETTLGLFGAESVAKSHALEKAEVSSYIKQQLAKDKKLFGFVSKGDRADELERGNNIIDVKSSKALADEATQGEEVYNKLSERSGPIADVLDYAAARIAGGENPNAVKQEAYSNIRTEITQALGGSKAASPQRRTAAREASLGTSDEKPQYRQPARKEHGNIEPLTNDELASWSKSRSLKIEEAGQQGGLFGGAEKMYRVSRIGSDGERESALVPESKIEKLRQTNTHVQKLVAQPGLFGPIAKNRSPYPWVRAQEA